MSIELHRRVKDLEKAVAALRQELDEVKAKRGPGRPRKENDLREIPESA